MGTANFATHMRRNPTEAEKAFLGALRKTKVGRAHFDSQVVLGKYIADFYWKIGHVVIEIDGHHHRVAEQAGTDMIRTDDLLKQGRRTIRYSNAEVLADPDGVVNELLCKLYERTSSYDIALGRRFAP